MAFLNDKSQYKYHSWKITDRFKTQRLCTFAITRDRDGYRLKCGGLTYTGFNSDY